MERGEAKCYRLSAPGTLRLVFQLANDPSAIGKPIEHREQMTRLQSASKGVCLLCITNDAALLYPSPSGPGQNGREIETIWAECVRVDIEIVCNWSRYTQTVPP